jgi:D-serine deaminase-like pyridoxal phosphate-dependent protein
MRVEELDTPAVIVDRDLMESNIRSMSLYCAGHKIRLRPHTKTHKIPAIARMQVASGACGITVAKLGEAEVMARAGLDNILIAYPIVGPIKTERLARLAAECTITVALDSGIAAESISRAAADVGSKVNVLVEFDVGLRRCGAHSVAVVVQLARQIDRLPALCFQGILFYPGHIWDPPQQQAPALKELSRNVEAVIAGLRSAGLECSVVSGGSTPTARNSHRVRDLTEIRAGTYVFNDLNEAGVGACTLVDCAVRVMVTVVSTAVEGRVIIDGGSKTFSSDRLLSGDHQHFGHIAERPDLKFVSMSEEHGHLDLESSERNVTVGDRLTIIPNHVCACVNLHDQIFYHREGVVEGSWRVEGRGRTQ